MIVNRLPAWSLVIGLLAAGASAAQTDAPSAPALQTVPAVDLASPLDAPSQAAPPIDTPVLAPPLDPMMGYDTSAAGGMSDFVWSFVKSMLMLGVVLALIYLILHKGLGRLVQRTQSGKRMKVVERIVLDQRRALYLIEVDGEEVLLAGSEGGVTRVDREPAPPPAPPRFSTEGVRSTTPPITGVMREGDAAGEEAA
jgi:flagellar biogenesis protein FliO